MLLFAALLTLACVNERDEPSAEGVPPAGGEQAADAHAPAPGDHAEETHGHTAAVPGEGQTLLVIMQKLGVDMAALTHGIMAEDTALVARSADEVAAHPAIAPGEVERIHTELGASMSEFERLDAAVHEESVALRDAARAGDMDEVLNRLHEVQRGCVRCHTQFRQRLRTSPGG
jgi:cytochrome c556